MNLDETTELCRVIRKACPSQQWTGDTPATWQVILSGVRLKDALAAVEELRRRRTYVDPADIVEEVRMIRDARLAGAGHDTVTPNVDPDLSAVYRAELLAIRTAIGDGEFDRDRYEAGGWTLTGARPLRALGEPVERRELDLSRVLRSVPELRGPTREG